MALGSQILLNRVVRTRDYPLLEACKASTPLAILSLQLSFFKNTKFFVSVMGKNLSLAMGCPEESEMNKHSLSPSSAHSHQALNLEGAGVSKWA